MGSNLYVADMLFKIKFYLNVTPLFLGFVFTREHVKFGFK